MPRDDNVTGWVQNLSSGSPDAAQQLWERYFSQMVQVARQKLPRHACRSFDEEDVALSAFKSFCAGVEGGRFPNLSAREDLWRLLMVITARKAQSYKRHETRQKRGGGQVRTESDMGTPGEESPGFDMLLSNTPTPAFLVEMAEQFRGLLEQLASDEMRQVALLKMEGHSVEEIAQHLNVSLRSVERRLQEIRKTWDS